MGVNGIYGLSGSGLDIESLVKMGMSGKNKQYDKMEQQEIANTWLKEAYNDVYNDLTTYKYGTLSDYKMQSNMNAMQATSSNSSVVTATANGAAAAMNHTVTITSVASNAYLQTTQYEDPETPGKMVNYGVTRENTDASHSNLLKDVLFKKVEKTGESADGVGTYKLNGSTTVNGDSIAISLRLKDTAGDNAKEYTLTYTYDELFEGEKTLNDFASAIARTGANIQGGYDTANDSFSFYNKTSGEKNIIGLTADNALTAKLMNNLNLGAFDAASGEMGSRIDFKADNTMKTITESSGITRSDVSVSLKDVLGLKATSVKTGDNAYDITVTQVDASGKTVGTLGTYSVTKDAGTGAVTGADVAVFSMSLSNGKKDGEGNPADGSVKTINFTLNELFNLDDVGKKKNLNSKADLNDFADKITDTGLGITAAYDAAKDSFSVTNPTGQANFTALGAGADKSVAETLISSLNLVNSPSIKYETVTNTNDDKSFGEFLGITSTIQKDRQNGKTTITMKVKQDGTGISGATIPYSYDNMANYYNGTYAGKTLFSFNISDGSKNEDGTLKTATVDVTYGDVINFAGMEPDSEGNGLFYYRDQDGVKRELLKDSQEHSVQVSQNDLSALATKINAVASANHLSITAAYDSSTGEFSLLNPNGEISLTDKNDSAIKIATKLTLAPGDPTSVAYKTTDATKGITRVNAHSTDDDLAGALGLSAVKSGDGKLKINSADGTIKDKEVNLTDVAFTLKVGDSDNEATVSITYKDLFDANGNSIGDYSTLAERINAVTKHDQEEPVIKVKASYDGETGQLSLTNDHGYATLTSSDPLGSALVSMMGLKENAATAAAKNHSWAGSNAKVTIDGKEYDNDTNKLTVAGVTYTFLESTENLVGKKATISVSQDTDKIVDYVKSFVDDYNKLLDSLNEKLSEQKYSDYKPLSKRQEDEMTEKQIDKWNEKAKSGILYHNSEIQALVSAMREAIYTKVDAVDSQYNTMSSIGITTTNTKGHLTLDTDKLKKALAEDPDCVYQLFASDQDSTYIAGSTNKNKITNAQSKLDYANTGVANRLYNVMTNHMSKISDIAGTSKDTNDQSYLGKLITNMQTKMNSFKTMMTAYENKLYKRYDAMEVALSKLNMQLGYISGSFS
ncbi:Flagellar hook-associated protein FliD [Anaerovibrio sp. JC8]|uniref:flagellar filament capping protein FliD n=1 Tax=Anaerovibrio sp. JC8 TaxID=1240085 RepID=UPI000A0B113F|nr:flagellar filament capping protein FliD [Anaerovibrio sp. JC8]ORU00589.1 Flagellar hook-associated protein FliD [Anaerovibrio sp. JC8]